MNIRFVLLIVVAISVAGRTALVVRGWVNAQRVAAPAAPTRPVEAAATYVLVAKKNLPTGSLVKLGDLRWQAWPDKGLARPYLVRGKRKESEVVGAVVRAPVTTGQPVTDGLIVKPGDRGFLAAVLKSGMRAVSVPVNATTGIAGFVFPGDRVDLILAHGIRRGAGTEKTVRRASETVLRGVRVLAVDQSTNDQAGKPSIAKTATLEVTSKQAEIIAVVVELGKLSLSLRSLATEDEDIRQAASAPASFTWDSDASQLLGGTAEADPVHFVDLIRGGQAKRFSFPKGNDVAAGGGR